MLRHGSHEGRQHRARQQGLQALHLPLCQGKICFIKIWHGHQTRFSSRPGWKTILSENVLFYWEPITDWLVELLFRCLEWVLSKFLHHCCDFFQSIAAFVSHQFSPSSVYHMVCICMYMSGPCCVFSFKCPLSNALYPGWQKCLSLPVRIYTKWCYHSCWKLWKVVQTEYLLMCYDISMKAYLVFICSISWYLEVSLFWRLSQDLLVTIAAIAMGFYYANLPTSTGFVPRCSVGYM